jgi:hypothetical protein
MSIWATWLQVVRTPQHFVVRSAGQYAARWANHCNLRWAGTAANSQRKLLHAARDLGACWPYPPPKNAHFLTLFL